MADASPALVIRDLAADDEAAWRRLWARGWSRLYWHTRQSNHAARRLYDSYTEADDFVRYRLFLS